MVNLQHKFDAAKLRFAYECLFEQQGVADVIKQLTGILHRPHSAFTV